MTPPGTSPPRPGPSAAPVGTQAGQLRERRAFRIGLGVSVVAHLGFVALYPLLISQITPVLPPGAPDQREQVPEGIRIVSVMEITEPDADPEAPPVPLTEPVAQPTPIRVEPADPDPLIDRTEEAQAPPSVAERLRPRMADPRLWAPLEAETLHLSDFERAELLLRGMIQSWSDSAAVAAALSGRALDWTFTDEEGRRWGLSPGRLHLGDFSIPLPFSFQMPPSQREEWERRRWEIEDLARGAASAEIRDTWAERAQEIRRRMEEERARRPGGE